MPRFHGCENYVRGGDYECPLLKVNRKGSEERICVFCDALNEKLEKDILFLKAFRFAEKAHEGQMRKGTDIPYMIHLIRTWGYVQQMTDSEEEQMAALLHDTLEDTAVTGVQIEREFGEKIRHLVESESEYKREELPPEQTWKIRKGETLARLQKFAKRSDAMASMHITLGDKLANLYSLCYEYRLVGDALWKKFNQKEKTMHGWYYGELGIIFDRYFTSCEGAERERLLVDTYKNYYREVFGSYEVSGER